MFVDSKNEIAGNLADVRRKMALAAEKASRSLSGIKLIAVSKTHPARTVQMVLEAGADVFGENKVQEAEQKIPQVGRDRAEWHLIGHLQSNKVRKAVKLFDVIHTLDSVELAQRLERICIEEGVKKISVLVQVDLAREETKNGITEPELPELVSYLGTCERIKFDGFMIIPPFYDDVEKIRPYFKRIRAIRDEVLPGGELSMGMSHDFETAIEEGATMVRVGTAIFGAREYQNK